MLVALVLCAAMVTSGCAPAGADDTTDAESVDIVDIIGSVDVDLTALSSTMVYAEVNNMLSNPSSYIGKTIKARGQYQASYYEVTGRYYHYIVVADATACCSQGLEFVVIGSVQPDSFPANGTEIELVGTFNTYTELDVVYNCLFVNSIQIVE